MCTHIIQGADIQEIGIQPLFWHEHAPNLETLKKRLGVSAFDPNEKVVSVQKAGEIITKIGSVYALQKAFFGLIPEGLNGSWQDILRFYRASFCARSETIFSKDSFKVPILKSRCLIPVTGWYVSWEGRDGAVKFFPKLEGETILLAGIVSNWIEPDYSGELADYRKDYVQTVAIVTTETPDEYRGIEERFPVILEGEKAMAWLDPQLKELKDARRIQQFFKNKNIEEKIGWKAVRKAA